ncbi:ABC transporter ATP-binding protein [Halarsenatibacter silvermanii]|uniref:Branched-chain amino acid transport system ATP-binding protein n=1 Tax=Halarsenatibacter silvermanii TaxID=321763 RepID=A0A1G9I643_9FIRM|nr:ABC transporter ATP-binding protein [Halarsenatibacter silvermanii]SDL20562.1 branched-chain amino acid transport system ATP-binding protein [Halarsenatibacter silvermanii]
MSSILELKNVSKNFGGIQAVDNCSLEVEEGSITGLIGPNGAGKTTIFNLITGFHPLTSGEIYLRGEKIQPGNSPNDIFRKGIYRSFQITRELSKITVLENLLIAPHDQAGETLWNNWINNKKVEQEEEELVEKALEILEFLDMRDKCDEYAGNLPGGDRKLLELGRMMMVEPELVLLDEPGAGVPPGKQRKVNERIIELNEEQNITFLVVEHDMAVIMNLCHPIMVLVNGSLLTEGSPEEVQNDERVVKAYLGE